MIEAAVSAEKPATREGLPSSYRMRADSHYVDWLASGPPGGREQMLDPRQIGVAEPAALAAPDTLVESIKAHGVLQPLIVQSRGSRHMLIDGAARLQAAIAAGLRKVPCITYDVDDEQARGLAEAARVQGGRSGGAQGEAKTASAGLAAEGSVVVARSLKTLALCADMIAADTTTLSRTVATDLIRAEVWRASCLLQAVRIVQGGVTAANAPVPVRRLIDRVLTEIIPEQRLRGFELDPEIDVPENTAVIGDEQLLATGIAGAVIATLAVLDGPDRTPGARLSLKVEAGAQGSGGQTITIDVAQTSASAPDAWSVRAFDGAWTERPGGAAAAVAMLSVAAIAALHQGRASVSAGGRGTRVTLTVPAGLPSRRAWH